MLYARAKKAQATEQSALKEEVPWKASDENNPALFNSTSQLNRT